MKLEVKTPFVFVLGLLIIGIVGFQSYMEIQRMAETNRWVIHTHEVLEKLEHVLSVLKDAETGQRGFVLTGEDRYLEPYNAGAGEIQKDIEAVASLTQDNSEQQQSIEQLRTLTHEKLDELQETIKLRRKADMAAALTIIRSDRGKKIMDEIRALITQMEFRENELLDRRNRVANEIAHRSMRMVGFGILLSLVVLGFAAVIVTRTMRLADRSPVTKDSGRKWIGIVVRYTFAVAAVALATWLRWWLVRSFGPMPLFITWYPAVLLVATVAGGGPGVVATLLSALVTDYWFIEPIGKFSIATTSEAVALGIFAGTGIVLSILAERLQRARRAEAVSVTQEKELALLNMGNLMALDLDHRIIRWSQGNRRLYGFVAQEAQDQLTYELLQTHFDQPLEQIHSELKEKGHWEGEVTRRAKDGTQLSVAILWALRRDERGNPLAILEVSTDITRQKLAEESLRQQSEELAQQNEELSQQSEELTQQSEELSEQNEELQTQSEEIQALNADLSHREKMLQTLLDSARLPIGEQEVLGKICWAASEMIGQTATGTVVCEQHGNELKILAHAGFGDGDVPGSWQTKGSFVEVVIQQDRTASLEDTSLRPDLNFLSVPGHRRFAAVLSSPLHVKGKPIGAVSIYSSKTHQWTVEQFRLIEWIAVQCSNTLEAMRLAAEVLQSQKQNEFLANILDASSQAFGVGYPDGRLGLINKAFEQLTGYSGKELRSIDWAKTLTPPEWLEIERQNLEELHRTGLPMRYEKEYIRKDGTHVPIELLVHVVKDAEEKPLYYYSFLTDITERKRAEEALRAQAELLSLAHDAIIVRGMGDKITFWNRGAEETYGWTQDEARGRVAHDLLKTRFPKPLLELSAEVAEKESWEGELIHTRKDGREIVVDSRWAAQRDMSGHQVGVLEINRDITDRKKAEADVLTLSEGMAARNLELESSNKDMESFIYSISHDLRAPIRTMAGFAKIIKEDYAGKLDAQGQDYLGRILKGSAKSTRLIDDLLRLSKISRQEIDRTGVNLSNKASKIVEELRETNHERNVEVVVQEGLTASADPRLIEIALTNLLGNAWKFTSKTENARIEFASTQQGGKTVYHVRDNGAGFDTTYAEKMFLPFHRLHSESEFEGTGIGLTIVERIIHRHGGQVYAEGEVGKGATIYFTLG